MGATVTCQKAVAAFKSPGGIPIHVLFESTYEKNVTPHTPSWGCCWVGRIEGALKRIFGYAADCEGGMLQTRRGVTTPESYITDWMCSLGAPAAMPDQSVRLLCGASYLDAISSERIADAAALLASHGLAEASRTLQEGGKAELRLHRHAEAIAALCGAGLASSFRLIDMVRPPDGPACDPRLGYAPARAGRVETTLPTLLKLGDNDLLVQAADGTWDVAGWAYDLVGATSGRPGKESWPPRASIVRASPHSGTPHGTRHPSQPGRKCSSMASRGWTSGPGGHGRASPSGRRPPPPRQDGSWL